MVEISVEMSCRQHVGAVLILALLGALQLIVGLLL